MIWEKIIVTGVAAAFACFPALLKHPFFLRRNVRAFIYSFFSFLFRLQCAIAASQQRLQSCNLLPNSAAFPACGCSENVSWPPPPPMIQRWWVLNELEGFQIIYLEIANDFFVEVATKVAKRGNRNKLRTWFPNEHS